MAWLYAKVEHVGWRWVGGRPDPDGLVWRTTTPHFGLDVTVDPADPGDLLMEWPDEHGAIWAPVVTVDAVRTDLPAVEDRP